MFCIIYSRPGKGKSLLLSHIQKLKKCEEYISFYTRGKYPQKEILEEAITLYREILSRQKDNEQLFNSILHYENELFDIQEELDDLLSFFTNQVNVFDMGFNKINELIDEKNYFESSFAAKNAIESIQNIISMNRPYSRLKEIPNYIQEIENVYNCLLEDKKKEIIKFVDDIKAKLSKYRNNYSEIKLNYYINDLDLKIQNIKFSKKLTNLDAIKSNLFDYEIQAIKDLISITGNENGPKVVIVSKSEIINSKVINKENINSYVEEIKQKLILLLDGNDEISIL
jgi:hypothetical protein